MAYGLLLQHARLVSPRPAHDLASPAQAARSPPLTAPCLRLLRLLRLPADTLKYYGFELGAMVNYDKKSGNSIVNGAHDAGRLSELLEGFITK